MSLSAAGGSGGKQTIATNEAEGPGGGGGGGYIAVATGTPTMVVTGGAGGTTNSAGVAKFPDNGATDGNSGVTATAAITAQLCQPNLAVSISNSTPDVPGGTITYTVTVVNDGSTTLTGATVVGALPGTLSNITWSCAASVTPLSTCGAPTGSGGLNTTATLPSGGTVTYTVTGTIAPTATGMLTSSVTAKSGAATSTASDTVTLTPSADVGLTITATPEPDALPNALTYSVNVINSGPSVATNGTLTITLDANETLVSATGGGWSCTGTTTLTCTQSTLTVATTTLTLVVQPTAVGNVTLHATVAATTADGNAANNTAMHTTAIVRCLATKDCPAPATCTAAVDTCALAPPVITAPADNTVTTTTEPTVSGTCAAGAAVFVSVDGGTPVAATVTGTTWTFTPTTPLPVSNTSHTFVATATVGSGSATVTSGPSNTEHIKVVACTTNGDCKSATAPFCSPADACVGCNGDAGSGATFACGAATPLCMVSGACGQCTSAANCVGHGGPLCNSATGACGTSCSVDADCNDVTKWCNAGVCTPKAPNTSPVPTPAPINGVCNPANGARVCLSGVCDTTNDECGLTNGKTCGPPSSPATNAKCDVNICFADNLCGEPNGQSCASAAVCRSGVCFTDLLCGEPNGQSCNANDVCRSVCVGADDECGLLNGTPCTAAAQCRSNVCNADGHCGDPNGAPCASATTCRSAVCSGGTCGPACTLDTDCANGDYCNAGACVPQLPNSSPCARPTMCSSGECNLDGKCGDPNGTPCLTAQTCRANVCVTLLCGGVCTVDAQCPTGDYCNAGACVPQLPNSSPCARPTICASAVCNADGACGNPTGQPCASAAVCRSALCDDTNTCAATCTTDADCGAAAYCDATSHGCLPTLGNGTSCTRGAQCSSELCDTDGLCGAPNGDPCGSSLLCRSSNCTSSGVCGSVVILADMAVPTGDGGAIPDAGSTADLGPPDMNVGNIDMGRAGDMAHADLGTVKQRGFSGGGFCALGNGSSSSDALPLLLLLAMTTLWLRARRRAAERNRH